MLRRLPIASGGPVVVFAVTRLAIALLALITIVVVGLPYEGRAVAVMGGLLLPWAVGMVVLARRNPDAALSPAVAVVDFVLLAVLEAAAPDTLGAVRVAALFLVASHAHFQGERRGLAVAGLGSGLLVITTLIRGDEPLGASLLGLSEAVFVVSALATALVVGRLRTAESASRLRARGLSRRAIQAESEVRRRVADTIHDGPVQELIGLDMMLCAARSAAEEGRGEDAGALIEEARELASRNVQVLRDEIVELGPYAYRELGFAGAIEHCMPAWKRRYGFEVLATIEDVEMPPEMSGALFRIAQEAVANAGRHAAARAVAISLRTVGLDVELRVTDNGRGFSDGDSLAAAEPGHVGLASMRERAEMLGGRLEIETSELGTKVVALAPLDSRPGDAKRGRS
jgi:two-component system, NarL family, sensor kinase